jgi:hypothetical protein
VFPARRDRASDRPVAARESVDAKESREKRLTTGSPRRLGIGFVGAGFMNRFHVQSLVGVRDGFAAGVFSPTRANAESLAGLARTLRVGEPRVHGSLADLVADPAVDALWIATPNDLRVEIVEEIVELVSSGRARIVGLACEKPLARNLAEAKRVLALVESTPLLHGYLENQVFEPSIVRGKEIIWRRAGPHARPPNPSPADPTSPAPPRSTAGPTCPGSGTASARAAASCPTCYATATRSRASS